MTLSKESLIRALFAHTQNRVINSVIAASFDGEAFHCSELHLGNFDFVVLDRPDASLNTFFDDCEVDEAACGHFVSLFFEELNATYQEALDAYVGEAIERDSVKEAWLEACVKEALETNDAAPVIARAFLGSKGSIEIGGHYPRTTYTSSDMGRNKWLFEVTDQLSALYADDAADAVRETEVSG